MLSFECLHRPENCGTRGGLFTPRPYGSGRPRMRERGHMIAQLNAFVESHPTGWNHEEWLSLLADLGQEGTDVSNPDEIGQELEKTRVMFELRRREVPGLGRKRMEAIANRFGTIRELQNASLEEMARIPGMNRALADKILMQEMNGHS